MHTMGGLIGGEAHALMQLCGSDAAGTGSDIQHRVFSGVFPKAAAYAMAVLETNASVGCIVAAPTAGSSGVIAALDETGHFSSEELRDALANAAAIGYVVTRNATVAGAEGGCQAEIGTASAMAASAATQLFGGSPQQCLGCSCDSAHEHAGPRLRSCRRSCRRAVPEAQCLCCGKRARLCRAGTCRRSLGRLLRRDGRCAQPCRSFASLRAPRDGIRRHSHLCKLHGGLRQARSATRIARPHQPLQPETAEQSNIGSQG